MRTSYLAAAVVAGALTWSARAGATPRPLPFTYTADTLGEGETEIENYVDLTPLKAFSAQGNPVWYTATQFQIEYEHGLTDKLELGLYVAFQPDPAEGYTHISTMTEGTGFKERLRLRLAEEGEWPVDIALYGELVEYMTEFEIEAKIILERRFGDFRLVANAWAEREYYYSGAHQDWVLNPTVGATYQITPAFHAGIEYWVRAEFPDPAPSPRPFSVGPNHFVGPALMLNFGHLWWTTGVYGLLNDINRTVAIDDNYGPIWVRTVVGIEL